MSETNPFRGGTHIAHPESVNFTRFHDKDNPANVTISLETQCSITTTRTILTDKALLAVTPIYRRRHRLDHLICLTASDVSD